MTLFAFPQGKINFLECLCPNPGFKLKCIDYLTIINHVSEFEDATELSNC